MLYHKTKIHEIEIRSPIYDEELFSLCPVCGKENDVDIETLGWLITEHGMGFADISVFCKECADKKRGGQAKHE